MENATLEVLSQLVDAKIVGLARSGERELEEEIFGFDVVLSTGEKKTFWILCDFEGNGPGGFSLEDTDSPGT